MLSFKEKNNKIKRGGCPLHDDAEAFQKIQASFEMEYTFESNLWQRR